MKTAKRILLCAFAAITVFLTLILADVMIGMFRVAS